MKPTNLTKRKVVFGGDCLQVIAVGTPIHLHQRLGSSDLVRFLVRKTIPAHPEEVYASVLRRDRY